MAVNREQKVEAVFAEFGKWFLKEPYPPASHTECVSNFTNYKMGVINSIAPDIPLIELQHLLLQKIKESNL